MAFNWAFIGAGTLGRQVAREITASGRHAVKSVYVRTAEKRAAFAEAYGAYPAASAEEAIGYPGVDGVYVVTPHTSHFEFAALALKMGKPVLCEKPVTTDARQAAELIRLSREKGVYFAEAMWTWFAPAAHQVKKWLDAGEYGDIREARLTYRVWGASYAPRVTDPLLAGGALLDIGVYPLTYLYRLFGYPEAVQCKGRLRGGIDTGEDIVLTYPGGKAYTISVSITDTRNLEKLTLRGDKARTVLPCYHYANSVTLHRTRGAEETVEGYGGMLNEFDRVSEEIRQGLTESALVPHRATLDVMKIMDECRRQMGLVYPFETDVPAKLE